MTASWFKITSCAGANCHMVGINSGAVLNIGLTPLLFVLDMGGPRKYQINKLLFYREGENLKIHISRDYSSEWSLLHDRYPGAPAVPGKRDLAETICLTCRGSYGDADRR